MALLLVRRGYAIELGEAGSGVWPSEVDLCAPAVTSLEDSGTWDEFVAEDGYDEGDKTHVATVKDLVGDVPRTAVRVKATCYVYDVAPLIGETMSQIQVNWAIISGGKTVRLSLKTRDVYTPEIDWSWAIGSPYFLETAGGVHTYPCSLVFERYLFIIQTLEDYCPAQIVSSPPGVALYAAELGGAVAVYR